GVAVAEAAAVLAEGEPERRGVPRGGEVHEELGEDVAPLCLLSENAQELLDLRLLRPPSEAHVLDALGRSDLHPLDVRGGPDLIAREGAAWPQDAFERVHELADPGSLTLSGPHHF